MAKKKQLRWRGMTTLFLVMALIVDAASGIVLFLSPAGSIARWSNWSIWGLNKDQWESIHIVFSLVLLLILAGHIYFNWRMLTHFVWDKFRQVVTLKKEMAGALVLTVLLVAGTLWSVQPLDAFLDVRETMKRNGDETFVPGQGRGFSRDTLSGAYQTPVPGSTDLNHFQNKPFERQQPLGRGMGRRTDAQPKNSPIVNVEASQLKGRDYVGLGKLETHMGILVRLGEEWGLKSADRVFEIHMGPAEYRASKGFTLKEGEKATVSGFVYQSNLSVASMESGGKAITLRDETGRPVWSGSGFGRGAGRGGQGAFPKNNDS